MSLLIRKYIIILKEKYYTTADFKPLIEYFTVSNGKTDIHLIRLWGVMQKVIFVTKGGGGFRHPQICMTSFMYSPLWFVIYILKIGRKRLMD